MSVLARLTDKLGKFAGIKSGPVKGDTDGLVVYSSPQRHWVTTSIPFLSDAGSPVMAVDASASGGTEGIHDGTDSVLWTGSALIGTWDFASTTQANSGTKSVDATATVNGDLAQFERSSAVDSADFSIMTGAAYLTRFNTTRNTIPLKLLLAGVQSGITVDLGEFINASIIDAWQDFSIPLDEFDVTGNIDQLTVETATTSGSAPEYFLDDLNFRAGGGEIFKAQVPQNRIFRIRRIEISFRDNIDLFATVGANENSTALTLDPGGIMGVAGLANGIAIRSVVGGVTGQAGVFRSMADIIYTVFSIDDAFSSSTDAVIKLGSTVQLDVIFDGALGDRVEIIISDDLSGLTDFRGIIRGEFLEE